MAWLSWLNQIVKIISRQYRIMYISMYLAGEFCFMRNLIGPSISEYPVLFTSELNKMATSFVYFTEQELFFTKRNRRDRRYQICNEIWQLIIERYVFLLLFSDNCRQDVFQNVLFKNDEWVTSRSVKFF